jgi:hypothetical protein
MLNLKEVLGVPEAVIHFNHIVEVAPVSPIVSFKED